MRLLTQSDPYNWMRRFPPETATARPHDFHPRPRPLLGDRRNSLAHDQSRASSAASIWRDSTHERAAQHDRSEAKCATRAERNASHRRVTGRVTSQHDHWLFVGAWPTLESD